MREREGENVRGGVFISCKRRGSYKMGPDVFGMEIVPRAIPDAEEQSCLFEMVGLLFRF